MRHGEKKKTNRSQKRNANPTSTESNCSAHVLECYYFFFPRLELFRLWPEKRELFFFCIAGRSITRNGEVAGGMCCSVGGAVYLMGVLEGALQAIDGPPSLFGSLWSYLQPYVVICIYELLFDWFVTWFCISLQFWFALRILRSKICFRAIKQRGSLLLTIFCFRRWFVKQPGTGQLQDRKKKKP